MKKLPIGIQTFEKLRVGNYLYVDKTAYIHQLVTRNNYYFLSRPRRFGKSLLISTIKAFFEGKKDLFEGLYIYEKIVEWTIYPVIHIDYSLINYKDGKAKFEATLVDNLKAIGNHYGVRLHSEIVSSVFVELVQKLHDKHGKVVILVDEYDKPLVDKLGDDKTFEENRAILRELYGVMKGLDAYLQFVLLTGVSRFARVSVFSGMNNLADISTNNAFANIVGFTQEELNTNFTSWIEQLKSALRLPSEIIEYQIKQWYNGYSFDGNSRLYNPFSILNLFDHLQFNNYWFLSGTPIFLINIIRQQKQLPETFEQLRTTDLTGSFSNKNAYPILQLLFQTGYLTIKKVEMDGVRSIYHLDYPNEEVKYSFLTYLLADFTQKERSEVEPKTFDLKNALKVEKIDRFTQILQSFLADIPARLHIPKEAYYHSLVYMILRLMGIQLLLEKETSKGRIDAVLELTDKVYILEFKFATNKRIKNVQTLAKKAIQQIETQKYYEPYLGSGKKIILLGIGFLNKQLSSKVKILE